MTRKSHRGIIGKKKPTASHQRDNIGPGIDFTELENATGPEIKKAAKKADMRFD